MVNLANEPGTATTRHGERTGKHAMFIPTGQHCKMDWKEKQKAGKSLVAPDVEYKYYLRYEHGGRRLMPGQDPAKQEKAND